VRSARSDDSCSGSGTLLLRMYLIKVAFTDNNLAKERKQLTRNRQAGKLRINGMKWINYSIS
jgi:hypothetical protein